MPEVEAALRGLGAPKRLCAAVEKVVSDESNGDAEHLEFIGAIMDCLAGGAATAAAAHADMPTAATITRGDAVVFEWFDAVLALFERARRCVTPQQPPLRNASNGDEHGGCDGGAPTRAEAGGKWSASSASIVVTEGARVLAVLFGPSADVGARAVCAAPRAASSDPPTSSCETSRRISSNSPLAALFGRLPAHQYARAKESSMPCARARVLWRALVETLRATARRLRATAVTRVPTTDPASSRGVVDKQLRMCVELARAALALTRFAAAATASADLATARRAARGAHAPPRRHVGVREAHRRRLVPPREPEDVDIALRLGEEDEDYCYDDDIFPLVAAPSSTSSSSISPSFIDPPLSAPLSPTTLEGGSGGGGIPAPVVARSRRWPADRAPMEALVDEANRCGPDGTLAILAEVKSLIDRSRRV